MTEIQLNYTHKEPVRYNDLYLRLLACLIGSHITVVYGETKSTFEILLTPAYYYAFAGSFIIAFVLFSLLRGICMRLDRSFDWKQRTAERTLLQLFWGIAVPGLMAFLLAALYFRVRGINILRTTYLRYDFQFILLQLLLINCYYVASYFYIRWSEAEKSLRHFRQGLAAGPAIAATTTFQVSKGAASILLGLDEIAYCYREGENNFLRTMTGEDFFISQSLDEMQQLLGEKQFFRLNRQMLAHRATCKAYHLLTYGKLSAELVPPFKSEVIISQKRAAAFKDWMGPKSEPEYQLRQSG